MVATTWYDLVGRLLRTFWTILFSLVTYPRLRIWFTVSAPLERKDCIPSPSFIAMLSKSLQRACSFKQVTFSSPLNTCFRMSHSSFAFFAPKIIGKMILLTPCCRYLKALASLWTFSLFSFYFGSLHVALVPSFGGSSFVLSTISRRSMEIYNVYSGLLQ